MSLHFLSVFIFVGVYSEVSLEFFGVQYLESSRRNLTPDNSALMNNAIPVYRASKHPRPFFRRGPAGNSNKYKGWPVRNVTFYDFRQSPVDVVTYKAYTMNLPVLRFVVPDLEGVQCTMFNSGHTVYVYIKEDHCKRPYLKGGPLREKFIFEQKHFHWGSDDIWGSEHFVDGNAYTAEIHMVHFNSKYRSFEKAAVQPDGLAVLTMFAEMTDKNNSLLEPMNRLLDKVTKVGSYVTMDSAEAMQWATSAFHTNKEYYAYPGSLTTPPYTENVIFILLTKPINLSIWQLKEFRELQSGEHGFITDNKRQLQPLNNRPIVRAIHISMTTATNNNKPECD